MAKNRYMLDSNGIIHASQNPNGALAQWIAYNQPISTDISKRECLDDWAKIDYPEKELEKNFLIDFFNLANQEGRYIVTQKNEAIYLRANEIVQLDGRISIEDAIIAATAEIYGLILVTADIADFARRLEKLNQLGLGNFLVQTYEYHTREETFQQWNEAEQQ